MMTALDLYDYLHAQAKLAQIPAIMITADPLCEGIRRALAERNIALIEKPFGLDELFQCIEQTMQPDLSSPTESEQTVHTDALSLIEHQVVIPGLQD
jgi:DNA-binding NtrC family response regulator